MNAQNGTNATVTLLRTDAYGNVITGVAATVKLHSTGTGLTIGNGGIVTISATTGKVLYCLFLDVSLCDFRAGNCANPFRQNSNCHLVTH